MYKGRISREFIHELLSRTNIIDLLSTRINLKKRGKNFYAHCPFHDEKTPSFTANSEKQFFYCFGCGESGNAIDFLMKYDGLEFVETIEELAEIQNLEIPYHENKQAIKTTSFSRKELYDLMNSLKIFYHKSLKQPEAEPALHYLKKRGLKDDIINQFFIGYAPPEWENISKHFGKNKKTIQLLTETGMLTTNNNGQCFDRFRNRIMFPIHDKRGKVIGFGGRILENNAFKNDIPKYLNSPETIIFHKGRQLYGLYEAKQDEKKLHYILLVEGYMDVIALAQHGINNSIASLGTTITKHHIHMLFNFTDHIVCCYDGDRAGREAAWRTLEIAMPYMQDKNQLSFMMLPNGEDPDTLIYKEGKEAFELRIKNAKSLPEFLFHSLSSKINSNTSNNSSTKLATLSLPLIKVVPGKILQMQLRQILALKIGICDDNQLEKFLLKEKNSACSLEKTKVKHTTMRILIGLLFQNPEFAVLVPSSINNLNCKQYPGLDIFINLINTCLSQSNLTTGQLLEIYRDTKDSSSLEKLLMWDDILDKDIAKKMFIDSLNHLLNSVLERRASELIARSRIHKLTLAEREEVRVIIESFARK